MATGYEQTSIEEVRNILRNEHGFTDEEFMKNTKTVLVQKLVELNDKKAQELSDTLDAAEEEPDKSMVPYSEEEAMESLPAYGSELWHEFVMKHFRDDELMDGAPTCDGCRRVIEVVLGPIIASEITHITPPSVNNNGTATVGVQLRILIQNADHPLCRQVVQCAEVADVNKDNCDHPYHKYASATAASRAEGRALRKLLRLRNIVTAEEVSEKAEVTDSECEWHVDEPISDAQINVIDTMCKRLNISVLDFVNSGKRIYTEIESITKSVAQRMLQELNKIQRGVKPKPTTVGNYKQWR
jgi:hypothetical protein